MKSYFFIRFKLMSTKYFNSLDEVFEEIFKTIYKQEEEPEESKKPEKTENPGKVVKNNPKPQDSKYKINAQKFSPLKKDKIKEIEKLNEQKEKNNAEIKQINNVIRQMSLKIKEIEKYNKNIDEKLVELSKVDPLENFFKHVNESEQKYDIDLTIVKNQFEKLFNELNKDNLQLNIDKTSNGFELMIEGSGFTQSQKVQIVKLKKLFKSLNCYLQ